MTGFPGKAAWAGESVTVIVRDGRTSTGEVDQRTDEHALWLRVVAPSMMISRGLAWREIVAVRQGEKEHTALEFRKIAADLATPEPRDLFEGPAAPPATPPADGRLYALHPPKRAARARSLAVDAYVANWDSDAEYDGIEIQLRPASATGEVIPLDGHLTVSLVGRRYRPARHQSALASLGRWSQRIRQDDFQTGGATVRLPFQSFDPQRDLSIAVYGHLDVQLGGTPHGHLKATTSLRLRPFDPF